ncbi:Nif3-like dinuclear metal center hexameric protein [Bythopirellula goksoeyrii]|uniref:GTP cyclohydrolase 1 type 2 homolog n=1 Tax=Bythopirellula goksoeyrii TaxID=1400387 RepID=A0A5B9QCG8_9BACT|nr:Nif3-like dinuclear metal center hexameric protein [Bythopirellula goksoeyrii]QEG35295.1 GTP cyclohydrolase 1 type 2 [Bythopirellula goksoeyrii]
MSTVGKVIEYLEQIAPLSLAEDWDNVGLLVGDRVWSVDRLMTCLTITPAVVAEAIEARANLIVTHHPLPFHSLKSITADSTAGRLLLNLIAARIAVYSAHSAFDSARAGINQHLAIGLGLQEIVPLFPRDVDDADIGAGRCGILGEEVSLLDMAERLKNFLGLEKLQVVGENEQVVTRIAIACGSGGSFLDRAIELDCDCLITGETNFHTCLEAEARGVALILPGHFASERFGLISLADYLSDLVPEVTVWASKSEQDPLRSI